MSFLNQIFPSRPDFAALIAGGASIIDVRTPQEYRQGHVAGSVNIPLDQLPGKISQIKKMPAPLILCCASGMRSGRATAQLKRAGMEAYNGGSWKAVARYL
ncbi:MAG: rhodanese-like domain-containing protein [Bacteroidota bacterium]